MVIKKFTLLIALCFIFSCSDNDDSEAGFTDFNFPFDCCLDTQLEIKNNSGDPNLMPAVFTPNLITPESNAASINDRYFLQAHHSIEKIDLLEIRNLENKLVFRIENFPPNDEEYAWDGYSDGEQIDGAFKVLVQYENDNNVSFEITYIMGAINCGENYHEGFNSAHCQWMTAYDGQGGWNPDAAPGFCP